MPDLNVPPLTLSSGLPQAPHASPSKPSVAFDPREVAAFQGHLEAALSGRLPAAAPAAEGPGRMSQYLTQMEKSMNDLNHERLANIQAFPTLSLQEMAMRNIDMATRTAAVNINFQVAGHVTKSLRGSVQQLLKGQ